MFACLHAGGNTALLIECARHFSPRVEQTSDDTVLADIRGLSLLFGEPDTIAQRIANRAGLPLNIAIAANADTAVLAARGIRGITVIPPGKEAAILGPLPLNLLCGSSKIAEALDAWGIRTLGGLAALPQPGIAARLGSEGTHLWNLAQGRERRQLRPVEDPLRFEDEQELDYPLELLEPLSFVLNRLLSELCERLAFHALAADEISLTLTLENAPPHHCALRLPVPIRDVKTFLKLLQLELTGRPPGAAVLKVQLSLNPARPRSQQHGLFMALSPEPAKLEVTLSRLINLLGAENVGTPKLLNSHRPDSFRMQRFVSHGLRAATEPSIARQGLVREGLVLRRFRPPQYAQVRLLQGAPDYVRATSVKDKVAAHAGPWRSSGEWWQADPWDHAEWDVALCNGELYRLCEDLRTRRWFLEGSYD